MQADRIEIVLEERSDEHFSDVKSPYGDPLWTDSQKVRRGYYKLEASGHQFTKNNANHYSISLQEAHMDGCAGVPKFHQQKNNNDNKPWIINVQNQKGGTGKSMTAVHLAACLALNLDKRYRICLIDLDPQGSLRLFSIHRLA